MYNLEKYLIAENSLCEMLLKFLLALATLEKHDKMEVVFLEILTSNFNWKGMC